MQNMKHVAQLYKMGNHFSIDIIRSLDLDFDKCQAEIKYVNQKLKAPNLVLVHKATN